MRHITEKTDAPNGERYLRGNSARRPDFPCGNDGWHGVARIPLGGPIGGFASTTKVILDLGVDV